MASNEKAKLPNLKICIDNDNSESDDDNLSLTDEPQIQIEEGELDKRIANPVSENISAGDSPSSEHALADEDDVQFNVYLNKLDTKPVENTFPKPSRRYENKEGNFVTGIDFTKQETSEKLQERAKRFGIEYKPEPAVNLEDLYKSLGLKPDDFKHKDERGIRLEAVHIRGVNEMNTKDVFNYFQEFAAGGCEWIDDESCNVVWLDKMTAARAILKLSRSYEEVMAEYGLKVSSRRKEVKNKEKNEAKMEEDKINEDKENDGEADRDEEKMEEDNDELDLTEDKKSEENGTQENKVEEQEKMEDEGIEEGEITDSESEPEVPSRNQNAFNKIPWPPGKWRLGVPYKDKASHLFLRFATKADVKLPGAEKRSKFYQKYGNPNYGGRVGLLSRSMKQKLRGRRGNSDLDTFGVPDSAISMADRNQSVLNLPCLKLKEAKDVRWLSHDQAVRAVRQCLPAVVTSLEFEANEKSDAVAQGLSVFVQKYEFVAALYMMSDVLPVLSTLSRALQTRDCPYSQVGSHVAGTIATVKSLRQYPGEYFRSLPSAIDDLVQQPFQFKQPTETQINNFRDNVYNKFIDSVVKNLEKRFPHITELEAFGVFNPQQWPEDTEMLEEYGSEEIQVSYEDDLFSDTITPVEVEEIDLYTTSQKIGKNKKKSKEETGSDEEEMYHSSEENDFPVIERVTAVNKDEDRGTDSDVDEEELERLLGAKEKKPMMRMYADELEEKQKANRQRQMVGALTIVADAKKKVKSIKDARQLITGVDLRTALQERKMNREWSPDTWTRSKSRSRSLSPHFERDMGSGMNFKIVTPMHMTIENEVKSDIEEVKEMSPEPVKEIKRKKRLNSPLGLKSKMDEVEKPKDIRSRLSRKANDDLDTRISRSPNNVKSRLSKRLSPENESPDRFDDRRISRVRRSRSHEDLRSKFNRSHSPVYRDRNPLRRRSRTRSPVWRRYNRRRSPVRRRSPLRRSPIRRFNRSRSRSPINRRPARSNIRSRSPVNRRINDRTRSGRNVRSRLGRKSRSPTDTESDSDNEQVEPSRIKMTVDASSGSSSSSSSSDSSSDESSSSSDSSSSSSSSSSSDSSSSSSDSESDSDASERSAIRNKKTQRKMDDIRLQRKVAARKDNREKAPPRRRRRAARDTVN